MYEDFPAERGKLQAKPLQTQLLMDLLRSLQPSAWGYLTFGLKVPYLDLAVRNQFWLQVAYSHRVKLCGILFGRKGIFFVQNRNLFSSRGCIWRLAGQITASAVQTASHKPSAAFSPANSGNRTEFRNLLKLILFSLPIGNPWQQCPVAIN